MPRAHAPSHHRDMNTPPTPQAAAAATATQPLPDDDRERVRGFGVMGLPFSSGHYLAFRDFPTSSFSPAYLSVWHRDPDGVWTFYATTPGPQSCSRYFSSATTVDPVVCEITATWTTPWSLTIAIPGVLNWRVDITATAATRALTAVGARLPARTWTSRGALEILGRTVGPVLGAGGIRLAGTAPNGQQFRVGPQRVWLVADSTAAVHGQDLGPTGPLPRQARLADFRLPQRGICVVGQGLFDPFDVHRHRDAERLSLT